MRRSVGCAARSSVGQPGSWSIANEQSSEQAEPSISHSVYAPLCCCQHVHALPAAERPAGEGCCASPLSPLARHSRRPDRLSARRPQRQRGCVRRAGRGGGWRGRERPVHRAGARHKARGQGASPVGHGGTRPGGRQHYDRLGAPSRSLLAAAASAALRGTRRGAGLLELISLLTRLPPFSRRATTATCGKRGPTASRRASLLRALSSALTDLRSLQPSQPILRAAVDAGLKDELVFGDPTAPRYVWWEGKLRPVPAGPAVRPGSSTDHAHAEPLWRAQDLPVFDLLSILGKLRAGLGALGLRPPPPAEEESVEAFVRRNLARAACCASRPALTASAGRRGV